MTCGEEKKDILIYNIYYKISVPPLRLKTTFSLCVHNAY